MTRAVTLAVCAAVLIACGGDGGTSATSSPTGMSGMDHGTSVSPADDRPTTDATVRIVAPNDGDVLEPDVELVVELEGAEVVAQTSTDLRPDQGHLHVVLDDQLVSMTEGLEQTIPDVAAGTHLLKVEFVANDHAPFDPRVIDAVAFEVGS